MHSVHANAYNHPCPPPRFELHLLQGFKIQCTPVRRVTLLSCSRALDVSTVKGFRH